MATNSEFDTIEKCTTLVRQCTANWTEVAIAEVATALHSNKTSVFHETHQYFVRRGTAQGPCECMPCVKARRGY